VVNYVEAGFPHVDVAVQQREGGYVFLSGATPGIGGDEEGMLRKAIAAWYRLRPKRATGRVDNAALLTAVIFAHLAEGLIGDEADAEATKAAGSLRIATNMYPDYYTGVLSSAIFVVLVEEQKVLLIDSIWDLCESRAITVFRSVSHVLAAAEKTWSFNEFVSGRPQLDAKTLL
jgi:hypothetical protein